MFWLVDRANLIQNADRTSDLPAWPSVHRESDIPLTCRMGLRRLAVTSLWQVSALRNFATYGFIACRGFTGIGLRDIRPQHGRLIVIAKAAGPQESSQEDRRACRQSTLLLQLQHRTAPS